MGAPARTKDRDGTLYVHGDDRVRDDHRGRRTGGSAIVLPRLDELPLGGDHRAGGPVDDDEDVEAGVWGGVIPIRRIVGEPVPDQLNPADAVAPPDVLARSGR